ncbi:hypothetical protein SKAU_G00300650 [Synaphobranchus kaupii]|uniref:Uncharacterized protein n=1 Tax=Synaphobranchus kaupii TaxID=118154 RepID=A0A9Q1EVQ7_SYNKA|nr:hypothetical protein SKAU_G00300650 [Synaphobranchus kaupii]
MTVPEQVWDSRSFSGTSAVPAYAPFSPGGSQPGRGREGAALRPCPHRMLRYTTLPTPGHSSRVAELMTSPKRGASP